MNLTPYHAKLFAHELTKRCPSDSIEKLAGALVDAQVDLNPHQIEAALFAFRSPLSKGPFSPTKSVSGRQSKQDWFCLRSGRSANGGFSSLRHRIFASSGIKNFKRNSFSPAAFSKQSPTMRPSDKAMSGRSSATTSSFAPTSLLARKRLRSA